MATVIDALSPVLYILEVVFGLGFVIFLHELGHFVAAKWAGVKVEKFFLGFDPMGLRLVSFRRGETLYGIGLVPLGGYVKMLGEEPGEDSERSTDPRAFGNKSVGARAVILSAGVVMNLLLGIVLFAITQAMGTTVVPAKLGLVVAGSPAYEAGFREGDEVLSIDGRDKATFNRLMMKVSLSGPDKVIKFGVQRPGVAEPIEISVVPKRKESADRPSIGVSFARSLELDKKTPFPEKYPGSDGPPPKSDAIPTGGTIVEAGAEGSPATKVDDFVELEAVFARNRDKPITLKVAPAKDAKGELKPTQVTLPVVRRVTFGLRMTPGPITSIQKGSIAAAAGFRVGDRIVSVEGAGDFDPMHLPDDLYARAGKPTKFAVERKAGDKVEPIEIVATPDASIPRVGLSSNGELAGSLELSGLGLAFEVEPRVAGVEPGSPADRAGIKPGAILRALVIPPIKDDPKAKPTRLVFGKPAGSDAARGGLLARIRGWFVSAPKEVPASWPGAFTQIQEPAYGPYEVATSDLKEPAKLTPTVDPTWFEPTRGLNLLGVIRKEEPKGFAGSVKGAVDEAIDNVLSIYATIRSLFQGMLSPRNLAGLPRIAVISYQSASMGLVSLLHFLGMLSINLAVLNFLPIPPLDGGQIAFLLAEKIRGKPLPENAINVFMLGGLGLVGVLMLFTILQDVFMLIFG